MMWYGMLVVAFEVVGEGEVRGWVGCGLYRRFGVAVEVKEWDRGVGGVGGLGGVAARSGW